MKIGFALFMLLNVFNSAQATESECQKILSSYESLTPSEKTIETWLNKNANFSGPNCYQAALLSAGALNPEDVRYISPEEFEAILSLHFKKVESPAPGDVVVYEANFGRGHAAFLLADGMVFHKKSFNKNYRYRILPLEEVGVIEADEWVPSPWEDFSPWTEINIGKTPKAYYRADASKLAPTPTAEEVSLKNLSAHLQAQILIDGPNWRVGKNMGLGMEVFLNTALSHVKQTTQNKLIVGRLTSLKDQVFMSIEETHFSNRNLSERRANEIKEEICFPDNEFLDQTIRLTANLFQKDPEQVLSLSKEKLKTIDRKKCNFDLFSFIKGISI